MSETHNKQQHKCILICSAPTKCVISQTLKQNTIPELNLLSAMYFSHFLDFIVFTHFCSSTIGPSVGQEKSRIPRRGEWCSNHPTKQTCNGLYGLCISGFVNFEHLLTRPVAHKQEMRKVYSVFSTVFLLLLLLAVGVGFPPACFGR